MTTRTVPGSAPTRRVWGDRSALLAAIVLAVGLGMIAVLVAYAARSGREVPVLGLAVGGLAALASLRWPLLPLFALAVLIPFEQAVFIDGIGTLSRYAEMAFLLSYGVPRLGSGLLRAMPAAGWGYIAWALFSSTWALDPGVSWTQIPALALLFPFAIVVAALVVERPDIVRPLLWTYSLAATATAALGILAFVVTAQVSGAARAAALADQNPAYFAAILLPAVVFGLSELLAGRWVLPSLVMTLMAATGIIVSGTRGAWVSLIVVVLFLLPRLDPLRRIGVVIVVVTFLGLSLQVPGVADLVTERTDTALSTGGSGRTDIWTIGVRIFASSPVIGVGLANFPVANTPERVRDSPIQGLATTDLANLEPHNLVIQTMADLGIVGLLLLGTFLLPLVLGRAAGPDATMVQGALSSLLVIALFLDMTTRKELWLLIGILCGLRYLGRRDGTGWVAADVRP